MIYYDCTTEPGKKVSRKFFKERYGISYSSKEFKVKFDDSHVVDDPFDSEILSKLTPIVCSSKEELHEASKLSAEEI